MIRLMRSLQSHQMNVPQQGRIPCWMKLYLSQTILRPLHSGFSFSVQVLDPRKPAVSSWRTYQAAMRLTCSLLPASRRPAWVMENEESILIHYPNCHLRGHHHKSYLSASCSSLDGKESHPVETQREALVVNCHRGSLLYLAIALY